MPGMPKALPSTTLAVLRPTPGSVDEVLQPGRHLAAVTLDERLAELEQRLGLGAEEPERADDRLEPLAVGAGHRAGVGVGREQRRPHGVDPLVGGLRAQHGDDQQLEGVVEVELAPGVGVGLAQHAVDPAGPADQGGAGLAGRRLAAAGGPAGRGGDLGWHGVSLRRRTDGPRRQSAGGVWLRVTHATGRILPAGSPSRRGPLEEDSWTTTWCARPRCSARWTTRRPPP